MRHIDVFNGDADGICALRQLRLAEPVEAELVTGLKHEIGLLARVEAGPGDRVTVLDVSLARNRRALEDLLARGATVRYFDHHDGGELPAHPRLEATIDPTGLVCTSELVSRALGGRFAEWAVVGAFGDNFREAAARLAGELRLDPARVERLRALGESINYNAYGASEADVMVPPAELYRIASRYRDPIALLEAEPAIGRIARSRAADLEGASKVAPLRSSRGAEVHLLPDAAASRRVIGAFANERASDDPQRAHAVLAPLPGGGYAVSVRAPRGRGMRAADFCRAFPGGGGRATAAGIGRLEAARLEAFLGAFEAAYGERAA